MAASSGPRLVSRAEMRLLNLILSITGGRRYTERIYVLVLVAQVGVRYLSPP